uniref:Uncharacterized protein LOC105130507 isoform X2 n=1 Tax=Rhizophora mucronata TaxID=61149 RepID=A0A2P2LNV5_RHIMU
MTREECNRLTDIIKSRVVDFPITGGAEGQRQDVDASDICNTAVIEAKKWLEEKKSGSNLKSKLEYETCTFNTAMLPRVTEVEAGSPVDLAKSYMRARPPWASPSSNQIQHYSSSPTGIQMRTPYSFGGNSVSSSKLTWDSPTSSKILEEIRSRVKSKATEDMLRARPSSKIDWSALASDYKSRPNLFLDDKVQTSMEDNIHCSTQLIEAPIKLVNHVTTHGLPVSQAEHKEGFQNHEGFSNPATCNPEGSQDPQAMQIIEEKREAISGDRQILQPSDDVKTASHSATTDDRPRAAEGNSQPLSSSVGDIIQDAVPDSSPCEISCSTSKEVARMGDAIGVNGFPSPGTGLSVGQEKEQNARLYDEEHNAVGLDGDKMTGNAIVEENCELLSEASVEVPLIYLNDTEIPIIEENNSVDSDSQYGFSMHPEPLLQGKGRPNAKRAMAGKTSSVAEKQQGRKVGRYNNRGRGRS